MVVHYRTTLPAPSSNQLKKNPDISECSSKRRLSVILYQADIYAVKDHKQFFSNQRLIVYQPCHNFISRPPRKTKKDLTTEYLAEIKSRLAGNLELNYKNNNTSNYTLQLYYQRFEQLQCQHCSNNQNRPYKRDHLYSDVHESDRLHPTNRVNIGN